MYESEPHIEWQRLHEIYHAMSEVDLLELAAKRDDLTQIANEVLNGEMSRRRIRVETPAVIVGEARLAIPKNAEGGDKHVALTTLYDALNTGNACRYLEQEGVLFEVHDHSSHEPGFGSPIAFQLIVHAKDREWAKAILRERMGLFPLQEVAVADEPIDDGTVATLGDFGRHEEAEEIAQVLQEAQIWHRIVKNSDGTIEDEDCYTVEVREIDLLRACEVVERTLNLPEIEAQD